MDLFDIAVAKKLAGGGGGGGGGGLGTLLAEKTYNITTTSTSAEQIDGIFIEETAFENKIVVIDIEDTAGPREGYFYGWANVRFQYSGLGGTYCRYVNGSLATTAFNSNSTSSGGVGVHAAIDALTTHPGERRIKVYSRYDSSKSGTIDGTYKLRVIAIPFA